LCDELELRVGLVTACAKMVARGATAHQRIERVSSTRSNFNSFTTSFGSPRAARVDARTRRASVGPATDSRSAVPASLPPCPSDFAKSIRSCPPCRLCSASHFCADAEPVSAKEALGGISAVGYRGGHRTHIEGIRK
jgi:hypothetical protein